MIPQFCVEMYYVHTVLNQTNADSQILHNSKRLATLAAFFSGVPVSVPDRCGKCPYWKKMFMWTCFCFIKRGSNFCCPLTTSKCSQLRMPKFLLNQEKFNDWSAGKWKPITMQAPHCLLRHHQFAVLLQVLGYFQLILNSNNQRNRYLSINSQ